MYYIFMQKLNLFAYDQDIGQKLKNIKQKVKDSSTNDRAQCKIILEYFQTACDPIDESCSKANQHSYQGMIAFNSVCFDYYLTGVNYM